MEKQYRSLVENHGSPILILDCDKLIQQYKQLNSLLPNVTLYYAIKSLPHPAVIDTLDHLGAHFDIATTGEIELLQQQRVQPRNTIHTHPIKKDADIRNALRYGCTTFIIDNIYELEKFISFKHRVGLLIRISFPNPDSPIDLSRKFGCRPDDVDTLLRKAKKLGINIKGLSFHAGSQCPNSSNHVYAINQCHQIIERVFNENNKILPILDIGGGFPIEYTAAPIEIEKFCHPIRDALAQLPDHIQIIAEPGRFISAPSMTTISSIVGKANRGDKIWYYLDDGVYGSYSGQVYDHATYPITVFGDKNNLSSSVLAGPTCDSIDVIADDIELPALSIGDLVIGTQMGAYTSASATDFNLIERAKIVVINKPANTKSSAEKTFQQN